MNTKSILLLITILATVIVVIECGEYHTSNGTTYFISYPVKSNWFQSQRYCTYYNIHLVSIHSIEEHEEVMAVLKAFEVKNNIPLSNGIYFYTSGTDAGHYVNDYYWSSTGLPTIFKNWIRAGIPDNASNKYNSTDDCLLLNGDHHYKWDDVNCYDQHYFMCQNKRSLTAGCVDFQ